MFVKLRKISEITATLPFTEFDFMQKYRESFAVSELGRIHAQLPLKEARTSATFGLVRAILPNRAIRALPYTYKSPKLIFLTPLHLQVQIQVVTIFQHCTSSQCRGILFFGNGLIRLSQVRPFIRLCLSQVILLKHSLLILF